MNTTTTQPNSLKAMVSHPTIWMSLLSSVSVALFMWGVQATADQDPTTDTVPRILPYSGTLKLNGAPVNRTGPEAPWMNLVVLDNSAETPQEVFSQRQQVNVYNGEFTVMLGQGGEGVTISGDIANTLAAADNLSLQLTMLNDPENPNDDATLSNPRKLLISPFSMWARNATDFSVAGDLTVVGDATVTGDFAANGGLAVQGKLNLPGAINSDAATVQGVPLTNWSISGRYVARNSVFDEDYTNGWKDGTVMTPVSNSLCLLNSNRMDWRPDFSGDNDEGYRGTSTGCRIISEGGNWKLQARNFKTAEAASASVFSSCTARCLVW